MKKIYLEAYTPFQKQMHKEGQLQRILQTLEDLFLEIWVNYSICEISSS